MNRFRIQIPQGMFQQYGRHAAGGEHPAKPVNLFLKAFRVQGDQRGEPASIAVRKTLAPFTIALLIIRELSPSAVTGLQGGLNFPFILGDGMIAGFRIDLRDMKFFLFFLLFQ